MLVCNYVHLHTDISFILFVLFLTFMHAWSRRVKDFDAYAVIMALEPSVSVFMF